MTQRIFRSVLLSAALVFVASIIMSTWVLYNYYSDTYHSRLESQTKLTAHALANEGMTFFKGLNASDYRVTWIAEDGTVLYDTDYDAKKLPNHSDREEFADAKALGYGEALVYRRQWRKSSCIPRRSCRTVLWCVCPARKYLFFLSCR